MVESELNDALNEHLERESDIISAEFDRLLGDMQAMSDDERAKIFATHKRRFIELMKRHHAIGQKAALGFAALKQGPPKWSS
jgi:hypothetical protein